MLELKDIISDKSRLFTNEEIPNEYKTSFYVPEAAIPSIVALPKTHEEVVNLVKFAKENGLTIIPRAANTGLSGSQVPLDGGELVIDVKLMNKIIDLDEDTMTLTVEPGVELQEVQNYAESHGYLYPPDPGSKNSTIGGNIATNAGGMHAVKYGTTREYVRSLDVVLPNGNFTTLGDLTIKSSSGYDLKHLFIGSEGTLGITTKAQLKLIPLPKYRQSVLLAFDTLKNATTGVITILKNGVDPTALELFERSAIEFAEKVTGEDLPIQDGKAYVLMSIDSTEEEDLRSRVATVKEILSDIALKVLDLDKENEDKSWLLRRSIGPGIEKYSQFENLDEVVPINKVSELIPLTEELGKKHGIGIVNFGHAGDGNIHTILMRGSLTDEEWETQKHSYLIDLYKEVANMGGLPSAEHGIGYKKKEYFARNTDPVKLELMRSIKKAIDPHNMLNPGKVI